LSHFAEVIDGIVTRVIVVEQDYIDSGRLGDPSIWIQTSYNTQNGVHYIAHSGGIPSEDQTKALRKNFAGLGMTYDVTRDAFIQNKLFESWIFNEFTCDYDPPTPMPEDGVTYEWDEETISWVEVVL
tara:strand:- start:207 stop:587 length:381 start_codon:yes stop_codon:yes gene_type:complete